MWDYHYVPMNSESHNPVKTHLRAQQLQPANLNGTVTMELVGQAHVLSPLAAIQYGYISRAPGLVPPPPAAADFFRFFVRTFQVRRLTPQKL